MTAFRAKLKPSVRNENVLQLSQSELASEVKKSDRDKNTTRWAYNHFRLSADPWDMKQNTGTISGDHLQVYNTLVYQVDRGTANLNLQANASRKHFEVDSNNLIY